MKSSKGIINVKKGQYVLTQGNSLKIRTILIIITVFAISALTSCGRGYKVENDEVYYEYWNEGSGRGRWLLKEADASTFQELEFDCNLCFGKDKNHLFIDGRLIKNIDPNTFTYIGNYVFTDKDNAYFFGFHSGNLNNCAIEGIELDKLQLIKYPWAKAGNILIFGGSTLSLDDIDDFEPINEKWGKTKKYVFYRDEILEEADPETFKVINWRLAKDKNNTYEFGRVKE
jgi:hypothetical protein